MFTLSNSEWLLYGGLAVMSLAILLAVIHIMVFVGTGRKLKVKLEEEYGKQRQ